MITAGIDPGKRGGFVIYDFGRNRLISKQVMPLSGGDVDLEMLCGMLQFWSEVDIDAVFMENPHAIYGTGKGSMFTMGRVIGNIEAALTCTGHKPVLVKPKDWQNIVWSEEDIVKKKSFSGKKVVNDTKATSLKAFQRLFGDEDLRYGDNEDEGRRRTKQHDGLVDALLIAYYGNKIVIF